MGAVATIASAAGIVDSFSQKSYFDFADATGFTCHRYISCITRPSSRILPFLAKKSLIGVSFMTFITAAESVVPAAFTAFR